MACGAVLFSDKALVLYHTKDSDNDNGNSSNDKISYGGNE
jgi:hypothetical protein